MRIIRQIIRGAGYLEGYGHHPGNSMLIIMIMACGAAGIKGGFAGFLGGMLLGAVFILPLWIIGCVGRANDCDRSQARLLKQIKDS